VPLANYAPVDQIRKFTEDLALDSSISCEVLEAWGTPTEHEADGRRPARRAPQICIPMCDFPKRRGLVILVIEWALPWLTSK
jgi:hypothetical protein